MPNKNPKIPIYIRITSLVVVSGSSICSSSVNDVYQINNPYKDADNISIKKTMKQVGYLECWRSERMITLTGDINALAGISGRHFEIAELASQFKNA
jgi:hypothetical protein